MNNNFGGNDGGIPPTNSDSYGGPEDQYGQPEQRAPAVGSNPTKNMALVLGIAAVVILIGFLMFGGGDDKEKKEALGKLEPITPSVQPVPAQPIPTAPINIPPPQPIKIEPPIDDTDQSENSFDPSKNPEAKKRLQADMLITAGLLNSTDLRGSAQGRKAQAYGFAEGVYNAANDIDPNLGFADNFYNQSDVPHAYARKLGDTSRLMAQGKIIEAVLETPINTDIPGMIRGIVSRDIYAESGRNILIPKGSRLVGTYNSFVIRGNKRVNVIWSRVIRPDGVDIMIRSPGVDQLGRAGIEGEVDNKYLEIFSAAFLVSAVNIGMGLAADSIQGDEIQQTTNTDGSQTKTTTAGQEATLRAVDMFGDTTQNLIQSFINTKPTISINQGTRLNVFVNRDLLFPPGLTGKVRIIQ